MFQAYPKMAVDVLSAMFVVDGRLRVHLKDGVMLIVKKHGLLGLIIGGSAGGAIAALKLKTPSPR